MSKPSRRGFMKASAVAGAAMTLPAASYARVLNANGNVRIGFLGVGGRCQQHIDVIDDMREMILHPNAVLGLSDGGAHCGAICDASIPTFMLTHWARDRSRGPLLPLEHVVHRQTAQTAALYGLHDRGVVAPGKRADLNLIDFDRLGFDAPRMAYDLPAGGRRLVQKGRGYVATWVAGVQTVAHDEFTGALPGRLLRAGRDGTD